MATHFCFTDLNPSIATSSLSYPIGSIKYDAKIVMTMRVTNTADPMMVVFQNDKFFLVVQRVVQEKDYNWTLNECINENQFRYNMSFKDTAEVEQKLNKNYEPFYILDES